MASYLSDGCYCCGDFIANSIHADDVIAKNINTDNLHYETVSYDELDATVINAGTINCDALHCENLTFDDVNANSVNSNQLTTNSADITNADIDTLTTATLSATIGNIDKINCDNIDCNDTVIADKVSASDTVSCDKCNISTTTTTNSLVANNSITSPLITTESLNASSAKITTSTVDVLIATTSITLNNETISSWSDISGGGGGGGGSSSSFVVGDGIIGNDILSSISNENTIYSNYNKTTLNSIIKQKSKSFSTTSYSAEGYDIYSSVNRCLYPYSRKHYNTSTPLNNIINDDATAPYFLLNNVMPNEPDSFNIEHKAIYTYYNKSTPAIPSLSDYINDPSCGKLIGSIRDYALDTANNNARIEYIVAIFSNIVVYCVQTANGFSQWLTLFSDDGNIMAKNYNFHLRNVCRYKQRSLDLNNVGGWCAVVRSDSLEANTNGFMFYLFESEIITNATYNKPQLKLYSKIITVSAFNSNDYLYTIDLQRDFVPYRAYQNNKIYIFGYLYSRTHSRVERAACSCDSNSLNFVSDTWAGLPDPTINSGLTIHSQLRMSSFDNGCVMVGDYISNSFDVAIYPPNFDYYSQVIVPTGRYCKTAIDGGLKGCFIGCVSFSPFIPETLTNYTIANKYYFIMFDSATNTYKCYKINYIHQTIAYYFNVEEVASSELDLSSFTSFNDETGEWFLYYLNWSVDSPFAIYKNDFVHTTESGAEYRIVRLDIKIYDFQKNNFCLIQNGNILPLTN